jgi:hypothetical protein
MAAGTTRRMQLSCNKILATATLMMTSIRDHTLPVRIPPIL